MKNKEQIYSCRQCGQILTLLHRGGGTLVCCNQPMQAGKSEDIETEQMPGMGTPYWSCTNCHYVLQAMQPPDVCPSCHQACQFVDVSCYIPECGFTGVDSRLMK
uniref:Desulfoferrodoxin FeS4 iron-binding domain-containing protein n=1 Tax=candidate division WOR-3 bacterium TaxID=2052148 RepID=A0A7C3EYW1_UNCW3